MSGPLGVAKDNIDVFRLNSLEAPRDFLRRILQMVVAGHDDRAPRLSGSCQVGSMLARFPCERQQLQARGCPSNLLRDAARRRLTRIIYENRLVGFSSGRQHGDRTVGEGPARRTSPVNKNDQRDAPRGPLHRHSNQNPRCAASTVVSLLRY
jgi:hypothetical protein